MSIEMFKKYCVALLMVSFSLTSYAQLTFTEKNLSTHRPIDCQVSSEIERQNLPTTPQNMALPAFGQGVIGWGTGPEDALKKLQKVTVLDVKEYQKKGVTLAMLKEWQGFYENETQRNSCNPTAPIRAALMERIIALWFFA